MKIRASVVHEPRINPNCAGSMIDNSTGLKKCPISTYSAKKKKSLLQATHAYVLVPFPGPGKGKFFKQN